MRVRACVFVVAICCASLPITPADAAVTFTVEVGRFFDESDHTAEGMRFYPSSIQVAPGDSVHFVSESFHGVTLLPASAEPGPWASTQGAPGGPWAAFVRDQDEGTAAARVNINVATPSRSCGWAGQDPCEFDGTGDPTFGPLNSGLALFPSGSGTETRELGFTAVITADPGTVLHAVDPLHPAMSMRIEVVPTIAERANGLALAEQQFQADKQRAAELDAAYANKRVKKKVGSRTVWQAWAGVEEQGISLRRMYPKKLSIRRGDTVKWAFNRNIYEAHSVTFPASQAETLAGSFPDVVCDTDGDQGTAPDSAPSSSSFPFCQSASQLELDVPTALVTKTGDRILKTASDVETSGARGAAYAPTKKAYEIRFPKKSPPGGFAYACAIHEAAHAPMRATVVVK